MTLRVFVRAYFIVLQIHALPFSEESSQVWPWHVDAIETFLMQNLRICSYLERPFVCASKIFVRVEKPDSQKVPDDVAPLDDLIELMTSQKPHSCNSLLQSLAWVERACDCIPWCNDARQKSDKCFFRILHNQSFLLNILLQKVQSENISGAQKM